MNALFGGMPWWTPIPWVLAAIGTTVAILAFRRGRYIAIRLHRMDVE